MTYKKQFTLLALSILCILLTNITINGETISFKESMKLQTNDQVENIDTTSFTPIDFAYEQSIPLAADETIVYTGEELKSAIQRIDGVTTIYLGANITLPSTGIAVSPQKNSFIINGTNPFTGVRHTLSEANVNTLPSTIYVTSNTLGNSQIELCNLDIKGQSYYGSVSVAQNIANVKVTYTNVYYEGPQLIYNPAGILQIDNSTIIQNASAYYSSTQEIGEVNKVEFYGEVHIQHHPDSTNGLFIFTNLNQRMIVKENANVIIESDHFFEAATTYALQYIGETNSNLKFTSLLGGQKRIFSPASVTLDQSALTLQVNAPLSSHVFATNATHLTNNSSLNLYVNSNITTQSVYQRGPFQIVNSQINYILAHHASSDNYIFNMDTPSFINSQFTIDVQGNISSNANSFIDSYGINLDNSHLNIKAMNNSGRFINAANGGSIQLVNKSQVNLYCNELNSSTNLVNVSSKLQIQEHSSFIVQVRTVTMASSNNLISTPSLSVDDDATFHVIVENGKLQNLIQLQGSFTIHNPKSFLLYASPNLTRFFYSTSNINYSLNGSQINQWNSLQYDYASSGGFNHIPTYTYRKNDSTINFNIGGVIGAGMGTTSVTSTNYNVAIDLESASPTSSFSFDTTKTKILSIGRLEGTLQPLVEKMTFVLGTTLPNTNLKLDYYKQNDTTISTLSNVADDEGNFDFTTQPLQQKDVVLHLNIPFLFSTITQSVESRNQLEFTNIPQPISFGNNPIPKEQTIYQRVLPTWSIEISDHRTTGVNWQLLAKVDSPFMPTNQNLPPLSAQLVYIDENNHETTLSSTPILIASQIGGNSNTHISWNENKGILLKVDPGNIYSNTNYQTTIEWILQDAP